MFQRRFKDVSREFQGWLEKKIKWYFEGAFRGLKGALKLFPRSVSRNF